MSARVPGASAAGDLQRLASAAVVAGLVGGVLIAAFLILTNTGGRPIGAAAAAMFAGIAAVLIGNAAAAANPAAPLLGVVLHFVVSLSWALGYVYLVRQQPFLLRRPWISGAAFGLVVYTFMQIVLLYDTEYHRPGGARNLADALVAHMVFYGIPVALVAARLLRRA